MRQKPFFLYLAHAAVHGPVQAKESDIADYAGAYDAGWDHIRSERFRRQISLGLFGQDTVLPPANHEPGPTSPPWTSLTDDQQRRFARYMEVYAAAVQAVDASTGRLVEHLERLGELDNTIIVFTSDNGATAEGGPDGTRSYYSQFAEVAGLPADWESDVPRDPDLIGGPQTYVHYPRGWAYASTRRSGSTKGTRSPAASGAADLALAIRRAAGQRGRRPAATVRARHRSHADAARAGRHRAVATTARSSGAGPGRGERRGAPA